MNGKETKKKSGRVASQHKLVNKLVAQLFSFLEESSKEVEQIFDEFVGANVLQVCSCQRSVDTTDDVTWNSINKADFFYNFSNLPPIYEIIYYPFTFPHVSYADAHRQIHQRHKKRQTRVDVTTNKEGKIITRPICRRIVRQFKRTGKRMKLKFVKGLGWEGKRIKIVVRTEWMSRREY